MNLRIQLEQHVFKIFEKNKYLTRICFCFIEVPNNLLARDISSRYYTVKIDGLCPKTQTEWCIKKK